MKIPGMNPIIIKNTTADYTHKVAWNKKGIYQYFTGG